MEGGAEDGDVVSQLMVLTNCSREVGNFALESCGWDLGAAVAVVFEMGPGVNAGPAQHHFDAPHHEARLCRTCSMLREIQRLQKRR